VIVVCGEALMDVISQPDGTQEATPGGGPFNTARALARLGVPAAYLGRLSSDEHGRRLAGLLVADGVDLELASLGSEATTVALALVNPDGLAEYRFVVEGTSAPNLTREMLPVQLGHEIDAIHVGTLGLVLEPMASSLVDLVRRDRGGRLVMLDPNVRPGLVPDEDYRQTLREMVAMSTTVKGSEADMRWLYPGLSMEQAADRMLGEGVRLVVVTLGERGAYGAHAAVRLHVPAPRVEVVDTIGAGDAFGAGLLAWLHDHNRISAELSLERKELEAAVAYACRVAAITCTRRGADPPSKRELELPGDEAG
jgi:fructokinase